MSTTGCTGEAWEVPAWAALHLRYTFLMHLREPSHVCRSTRTNCMLLAKAAPASVSQAILVLTEAGRRAGCTQGMPATQFCSAPRKMLEVSSAPSTPCMVMPDVLHVQAHGP